MKNIVVEEEYQPFEVGHPHWSIKISNQSYLSQHNLETWRSKARAWIMKRNFRGLIDCRMWGYSQSFLFLFTIAGLVDSSAVSAAALPFYPGMLLQDQLVMNQVCPWLKQSYSILHNANVYRLVSHFWAFPRGSGKPFPASLRTHWSTAIRQHWHAMGRV